MFEAHLGRQFDQFDGDSGGELDRSELLNLLNSLQLHLSLLDVKSLREQIDEDASGTISRDEFVTRAPGLIRSLNTGQESPGDWCKIDHDEDTLWYNKRSGEAQSVKPFELEQEDAAEPSIDDFMAMKFRLADTEARGIVEIEEFAQLIESMQLGLSEDQVQELQTGLKAVIKSAKEITWAEFQSVPATLSDLFGTVEESPKDWSEVPTRDGRSFWYNKRTRVSQFPIPQVSQSKVQSKCKFHLYCRASSMSN
jgi:Ca2+-binding EF-hand superfamily protein